MRRRACDRPTLVRLRHDPTSNQAGQTLGNVAAIRRTGSLDRGGEMDQGGSARHRAEAEANRWVDGAERAQAAASEDGVGGDDAMEVLGSVPLVAALAGPAARADPG